MKYKLKIFLLCMCNIVVLNLFGCGLDNDVTYIERAFYEKDESASTVVIKDDEVLKQFKDSNSMSDEMQQSLLKYDKDYFKDKMIVVVSHWENSGSNTIEVEEVEIKEGIVAVRLERESQDDVTDDMKNWGIIIELEKDNTVEQVVVRIE